MLPPCVVLILGACVHGSRLWAARAALPHRSQRVAVSTSTPAGMEAREGGEREALAVVTLFAALAHAAEASASCFDVHAALWGLAAEVLHASRGLFPEEVS